MERLLGNGQHKEEEEKSIKMHMKNYTYGKWKMKIGSIMKYAGFYRSDGLL